MELVINPTDTRERICTGIFKARQPNNPLGMLQEALEMAQQVKPLERKVFDAKRAGQIDSDDTPGQIDEALTKGILTLEEAEQVRAFDAKVMALVAVDDFDPEDLVRQPAKQRSTAPRKKAKRKTKAKASKKAARRPSKSTPPEPPPASPN